VACGAILLEEAKSFLDFAVKVGRFMMNILYIIYRMLQQVLQMASNS